VLGLGETSAVELRHVRADDPRVEPLLAALSDEYERRYGPGDEMSSTDAAQFEKPDGSFVVLMDDSGRTVAGGGIRRLSAGVCEVKRMWTAEGERRRGHASAVLAALEDRARSLGYSVMRLETGPAQPEALALYRGRGYREIPVYGPYERAVAFERSLVDDRP
jgi:GNAT superfamily N-acetyltransferase